MRAFIALFVTFYFSFLSINFASAKSTEKNQKPLAINKIAKLFEKQGGQGNLLTIEDFISNTDKNITALQLTQLPEAANQNSVFKWLRTSDSYNLIDSLLKEGACIFVVNFPDSSMEGALTINDNDIGIKNLLNLLKAHPNNGAILFIRPDSTKDVISHEARHWMDAVRDPNSGESRFSLLSKDLTNILTANENLGLEKTDLIYLYQFIMEQRGYATQQLTLIEDSKQGLSYVSDSADDVLSGEEATTARVRASRLLDGVFSDTFPAFKIMSILDKYQMKNNFQKILLPILEKYQITGYQKLEMQTFLKKYYNETKK